MYMYYKYMYVPLGSTCTVCVHVHTVISSTVQDGATPLYSASQGGHSEVVDILLKNGADPNLASTVWGLVCSFHHLHVYCVLISYL